MLFLSFALILYPLASALGKGLSLKPWTVPFFLNLPVASSWIQVVVGKAEDHRHIGVPEKNKLALRIWVHCSGVHADVAIQYLLSQIAAFILQFRFYFFLQINRAYVKGELLNIMPIPNNWLLLTYSIELQDGKPLYVASNCLPVKAIRLEPAGFSFHAAALRLLGYEEDKEDEIDDKHEFDEKDKGFTASYDSYRFKGKKKSGVGHERQDHYALLGLGHLRFLATEDQIRKSYREAALKHHPDKQAALLLAEETEEAKQSKKDEIETFQQNKN